MIDRMSPWFGADSHQPAVRQVQGADGSVELAELDRRTGLFVQVGGAQPGDVQLGDVQLGTVVLGNDAPLDGA